MTTQYFEGKKQNLESVTPESLSEMNLYHNKLSKLDNFVGDIASQMKQFVNQANNLGTNRGLMHSKSVLSISP